MGGREGRAYQNLGACESLLGYFFERCLQFLEGSERSVEVTIPHTCLFFIVEDRQAVYPTSENFPGSN
jgi:hypothetical protein